MDSPYKRNTTGSTTRKGSQRPFVTFGEANAGFVSGKELFDRDFTIN